MKTTIIALIVLVLLGGVVYYYLSKVDSKTTENSTEVSTQLPANTTPDAVMPPTTNATNTGEVAIHEPKDTTRTELGETEDGNIVTAYHYGTGEKEILFVGGIHGGYSWNTVLVAYELMDYLEANPSEIPEGLRVTVIPALNPDGLKKVVGSAGRFETADVPTAEDERIPGRFNANNVDLNRNFDCDWQASAVWQSRQVSGGTAAFSEPESQAFKMYIEANKPEAVIVWYSAAGGVYSSSCHNGVLPLTKTLTNVYAQASGYPAYAEFDYYEITGDMVNWLAKIEVPAISVLLSTHTDTEWDKNRAGILAVLKQYKQ